MPIEISLCKKCIWEHRKSRRVTSIHVKNHSPNNYERLMDVFICCPFAINVRRAGEPPASCPFILEHVITEPRESTIDDYQNEDGFLEEMVTESERIPVDFEQEI